jgi:hypothetical protein
MLDTPPPNPHAPPPMYGHGWRRPVSWWIGRAHLLPGMSAERLEAILAAHGVTNETVWEEMAQGRIEGVVGEIVERVVKQLPIRNNLIKNL